jgi:peptide/nickel transport system permease protein
VVTSRTLKIGWKQLIRPKDLLFVAAVFVLVGVFHVSLLVTLVTLAPLARMTRAAMLQALGSEYIRTARAAGLGAGRILFVYAFRNALLPVVTTLSMVFSFALGANVLVEKVFSWPGVGSFAIEALVVSDYAAVQGFVLSMAVLFVLLNLCVDIVYTLIDPRVRVDG